MTEICQRSAKLAIQRSIDADIRCEHEKKMSGDGDMEDSEEADPVLEIAREYFEEEAIKNILAILEEEGKESCDAQIS